jgi:abequosyltransferase
MSHILSICIPVYNRVSEISETLDSVIEQICDEVNIVISDNASTDGTFNVIEQYSSCYDNIKLFRWENNVGADRNYLKVVEMADGEFCWLLGSDDKLENGAISRILKEIKNNRNFCGLSVNSRNYDSNLKIPLKQTFIYIKASELSHDHTFSSAEECFSVLGSHFGYISAQIVNKREWDNIVKYKEISKFCNAYVHVYIIAEMLKNNPSWKYIHDKLVGWRSGNDSFLIDGRLRRLAIDVNGYSEIVESVYGKSFVRQRLLSRVATTYVWHAILGLKLHRTPMKDLWCAFKMCASTYWYIPKFWINTFPLFLIPSSVLIFSRSVYRNLLK